MKRMFRIKRNGKYTNDRIRITILNGSDTKIYFTKVRYRTSSSTPENYDDIDIYVYTI